MINLLMSEANFDATWAYPILSELIRPEAHVLIMPLSYDEGWSSDNEDWDVRYQKGSRHYEKIMAPFRNYRIPDSSVVWFDQYRETTDTAIRKIQDADIIFLTGSNPDHMMLKIQELKIAEALLCFDGIIIGDTYGSAIMMDRFDSLYEWEDEERNGLGLLRGFALESNYVEDESHLKRLIHDIEVKGKAVFAYPKNGGVLIMDGHYELLGDAFTCTEADLDTIYHAYEDAKSRQDYYGDNGNW